MEHNNNYGITIIMALNGVVVVCCFFFCCFFFVQSCYKELIRKVLETFKPGRFLMTLFANEVCVIIPYAIYLG